MTFQTSVATALPLVAPLQCPDTADAILIVAQSLQPDLAQGFQIDALRLRVEMERVFGAGCCYRFAVRPVGGVKLG